MVDAIEPVEFVLVASEAEALLAEQNFIKQYQPRFNIRLRDDKSYPYIAISMDEDFPRVYFTRERHRRNRVYFGPYSNAKRVRGTLDLLGKVFLFRSCEGAEPGRRSGSPCLDYYIKRCEAPCVGYVDQEEYREAIDGVIAFLSGRYREIERDLERRMKAAAERAGVRAGRAGAQPPARGALAARAPARGQRGGRHARRDRRRGRRHRRQRPGLPGPRRRALRPPVVLPDNEAERGVGEVAEEFVLQYYGDAMAIPPQVDRPARACRERERAGRGAGRSAAARRSRCAPPSAATSAGSSSWPSATRASRSTRSA